MRLAVFATHPIQYQAPLWRRLAKQKNVDLLVHYFSDSSVRGGVDQGFGVPVAWDQPLLDGYEHVFLSRTADLNDPLQLTVPRFTDYLRKHRFDLAFVNGYDCRFELQIRRMARQLGCPVIMRPELSAVPKSRPMRRVARSLFRRWFYGGVSAFAVIGEESRRSLLASGVPPEKMFSSPYSVDSDLFESSAAVLDREACRRSLGIAPAHFVLLFSGKLIPLKNLRLVLKALERMPAPGCVTLVVVGDGPERQALERDGTRLLGDKLIFAGFKNQSQLGPYFKAADALILPSLHETWGLVVNEAMHFGLPVVVSDSVGCARDLVWNRETGIVFRSNDVEDLAAALRRMTGNPAMVAALSRNARRVIQSYTPDIATKGIVEAAEFCLSFRYSRRAMVLNER